MNRALTGQEKDLLVWLLEHGDAEAREHLRSIPGIRVIAHCPCGCASIDFSVDGRAPTCHEMRVVSDFLWTSESGGHNGIFE